MAISSTTISSTTLSSVTTVRKLRTLLCRCNQRILEQKIGLMNTLVTKYGIENAYEIYQRPCRYVGNATIGQHYRHSVDHIQRVVDVAIVHYGTPTTNTTSSSSSSSSSSSNKDDDDFVLNIDYDTRIRGSVDEYDWSVASERIHKVHTLLEGLILQNETLDLSSSNVSANFMLSGNSSEQFALSSTIERELGFAAHHAIHHMATVKVIVTTPAASLPETITQNSYDTVLLTENEIPLNFGKAPSTVNYETDLNLNSS